MVLGIEGRSVVGNLGNVISRSTLGAGIALCGACLLIGPVSAQAPAQPAPAAEPAATNPPATPAVPAKPAEVVYAEPRITEEDFQKWNSTRSLKFSTAQKSIAPTNAETKELVDAANLLVDKMTVPKFRQDLYRHVVEPARRSTDGPSTADKPREILLKAITARSIEVLAQTPPHHPDVQHNVVILLGTLNARPAGATAAAIPYTGSAKALITVLEDSNRPLQCRIAAAIGLGRMGREAVPGVSLGDLSIVQRGEIATSLTKVLLQTNNSGGTDDGKLWYRGRLAEAIGDCGLAYDLNKGSGYIDALMSTATNRDENRRVRSTAIRAATQLQWDAQVNLPLVLHEEVKLLVELGNDYNKKIAEKTPVPAELSHANLDLYFALQPKTAQQGSSPLLWGLRNQVKRPGLNKYEASVTAAYGVAMPVINHIVSNPKKAVAVPPALIAAAQAWIDANPPQDRKPAAVSPAPVP